MSAYCLNQCQRIILLRSRNIYRNLAFESVLHSDYARYETFKDRHPIPTDILFWRDNPCVVIGRFQNAWRECDVGLLRDRCWHLARRESGGGGVFHDLGNLNISFVQPRSALDRKRCMEFLRDALRYISDCNITVGERFDLWTSDGGQIDVSGAPPVSLKISGASSRLGPKVAYHHCTLLCNANLQNLSSVLKPTFQTLQTRATESVRSPVCNLCVGIDEVQNLLVERAIHWLWMCYATREQPQIISVAEGEEPRFIDSHLFHTKLAEFQSWSWIYGSSPAFHVDLNEFSESLATLGKVTLHAARGGKVKSIEINGCTQPSILKFVDELSMTLCGAECRPFGWHQLLDAFEYKWRLQNSGDLCGDEASVLRALRVLSSRF